MTTKRTATFADLHGFLLGPLWLFIPVFSHLYLGSAVWSIPFFFIGMPLIDWLLGPDIATIDYTPAQQRYLHGVLLAYPFVHVLAMATTLALLALTPMSPLNALWLALGMSLTLAGQGDATAHELGHHANKWVRFGARVVLATVGYGHFQIAHVRQHHIWVGTPKDPVSAPRGKSFYKFFGSTLYHEYADAWKSELARLKHKQLSVLSWRNEMLMTLLGTLAVGSLCTIAAGGYGALFFALTVVNSYFVLIGVNYMEHYGLSRKLQADGRYERVTARHTWNAPYRLTNWIWFNLQRHPDHHMHGGRKFYQLESIAESPVLPTNYVGCLLLILVPPLWFKITHPRIDALSADTPPAA